MNESCIQIDDLARVVALPEGDPGRRHLDNCSRCQSLADMLREFAVSEERPAEAGLEQVDDRQITTISDITAVPVTPAAIAKPSHPRESAPAPVPSPARRRRLWFEFTGRQLVGAAMALLVVNTVGMVIWRAKTPAKPELTFPSSGAPGFFTQSVEEMPGVVVLKWSKVRRATAYRVIFRDPSLRVLGGLAPTGTTYFRLESWTLPTGLKHGRTVGWEVEALAGNDLLMVSSTRALRVP